MKRLSIRSIFFVLTGLFFSTALAPQISAMNRETFVLVSIPWRDTATLNEIYAPMLELLEEKTGRKTEFYVSSNYQELTQRLISGAADIGILGGNSYIDARASYPGITYLATCMQPTAFYQSLIVSRKDRKLEQLSDLVNRSFAFTDKKSTSGYLYPKLMLLSNGINPQKDLSITYFLNKHDKVYDAVAKGVIDAGGVSKTALKKAVERNGNVFHILAESDPIPRNAVVAAPHLSQERIRKIRKILADADQSPHFQNSDSILKGFAIKDDAFYNIVRDARKLKP
mgnify:CR=1 FL=1